MTKQILQVLEAYRNGCGTTAEVAEYTGLPKAHCSAYTSDLVYMGLIEKTGAIWNGKQGYPPNVYALRVGTR